MYTAAELRLLAALYIATTGANHFTLSARICGPSNNRAIRRLLRGLGVGTRSAELISRFFDQNWPDNLPWPNGIARNWAIKVAAE